MKFKLLLPLAIVILFVWIIISCANEVRPTGGPKDTIPPVLVLSTPSHKTTNFKGKTLTLEFSKFIKTDKLNTQLLITPRVESEYKVKAGSKKITIQFEEDNPFLENTTYTFNFQKSIKDLTEGNVWEHPKIVFSTGDVLDSLYISGKVYDLLTDKPVKDAVVAIYKKEDTLTAITGKPMYFTMTDTEGNFLLENLISADFRIYSFSDKNNNLVLNPATESYGFIPDTIQLTSSVTDLKIPQITLNVNDLRLVSSRPIRHYFDITFNKSVVDYQIKPSSEDISIYSNFIDEQKKIRIYNTFDNIDSLKVNIMASDSLNNVVYDTLFVKFSSSRLAKEQFTQQISPQNDKDISTNFKGEIKFNKPIQHVNFDSIYFLYDSTNFDFVTAEEISFSKNRDIVSINKKLNIPQPNQSKIIFTSAKGTFISADMDSSNNIFNNYKIINPVNYGTIKGRIRANEPNLIVQLLNNNKVVMEQSTSNTFNFNLVPTGNYSIRVILDLNDNGKWDPGNILENKPPEPVVFYKNPEGKIEVLSVKANWEMTDINIDLR